jgi:alkyldihydroxyacetonephosphate synthase
MQPFVYVPSARGYKSFVDLARALGSALPEIDVSDRITDRAAYARDAWPLQLIRSARAARPLPGPAAVAFPRDDEQVQALVAFAREHGVKLVAFGAGSGVCGAIAPGEQVLVVDTKRFTGVRVAPSGDEVEVGAGVLGIDLEALLESQGLTVGHFPSSIICSTIGGWVAARGAGQCSSRYGKIEDMLRGASCVLGSGDRVSFRRRWGAPNPLELITGSEGTLGIVTRATFRAHRAPELRAFSAYRLPSFEAGADTMRRIMQGGLRPAVLRLYDPLDSLLLGHTKSGHTQAKAHRASLRRERMLAQALEAPRALRLGIQALERWVSARAVLIVVCEGSREEALQTRAEVTRIALSAGGSDLGETPARAWFSRRYAVSYRQSRVFQLGAFNDTIEVAAPWSKLLAVYRAVRRAASRYALVLAHLSHAYPDGCSIYFTLVATRSRNAEARYRALVDAVLGAALIEGATLSHHHGVGRSKAKWLGPELGGGVSALARLRHAWDPDAIMNPGALESSQLAPLELPGESLGVDQASAIATFSAQLTLGAAEHEARAHGLSLGFALDERTRELTLSSWLGAGMPGAPHPERDPAWRLLAGIEARGESLELRLRPAPRRATGPDLTALLLGAEERIARTVRCSLALKSASLPFSPPAPAAPQMNASEALAWQRVLEAFDAP